MEKKATKVLLVDDTKLYLELERSFFNRQDCQVFTTTSGFEALRIVEKEKPTLVLLDLYLADMEGLKVLERIRAAGGSRVVAIGNRDQQEDYALCQKVGCDEFLFRPVTKKQLIETTGKLLNMALRVDTRVPVEIEVFQDQKKKSYFGQSRDLSAGGIYVRSDKELKAGTTATLSFSLPGHDEVIFSEARTVRAESLPDPQGKPLFGLAFQFAGLGPFERDKIEAFVSRKLGA